MGFYLLAILILIAVPIAPFLPSHIVKAGLGFAILVAFSMSIAGGVVFLVKWFRATAAERREYALTPIVVVLVVATVLDLLADAGALPGDPAAWTLSYGLEPLVLAWARLSFAWWPFHPVGYATSGTWSMDQLWFPIFLGWLAKGLVLRYFGAHAYRPAIPFFVGLVLGEFVVGSFWNLAGIVTGIETYHFWPY